MDEHDAKGRVRVWAPAETLLSAHAEGSSSNFVTVGTEVYLYAYFESLEREDLESDETMFHPDVRNGESEPAEELLSARFDCVTRDHFNGALPTFAAFYGTVREEALDEPQDLTKPYWHGPERTELHTKLLEEFFGDLSLQFRILFFVGFHTDQFAALFHDFPRDRWIGLGLTDPKGQLTPPMVTLFHYDDYAYAEPQRWQVTSIWELTDARINTLRHVFSLDFASDALLPPPPPDEPAGTPSPILIGPSKKIRKWPGGAGKKMGGLRPPSGIVKSKKKATRYVNALPVTRYQRIPDPALTTMLERVYLPKPVMVH